MIALSPNSGSDGLSILCLGAHSDDIEIGAGGSLLTWLGQGLEFHVHWCVLSASGAREAEAYASADEFLEGAASARIEIMQFRNSFFPSQSSEIKTWFAALKSRTGPDLLRAHFGTQASKDWFDEDVFRGLARLRGIECRAAERFAKAFIARKIVLR